MDENQDFCDTTSETSDEFTSLEFTSYKESKSKAKKLYPNLNSSNNTTKTSNIRRGDKKISDENITETIYPYFNKVLMILVFIIGTIAFVFMVSKHSSSNTTAIDVTQLILDLKSEFKGQPEITFRIIKPALRKVLNKSSDPLAPAVITILSNRDAEYIAREFALHIAKRIAHEKYIFIDEAMNRNRNPEEMKLKIDNKIKSGAQNDICNVIVVDKFHEMPFQAAMIFHNYCDHENALYKKAVYLFLLSVDHPIPDKATAKYLDTVAINQLRTAWNDAHRDKIDSLITRTTVSIVYIKKV